jgi:hypothetical protein
MQTQTFDIEKFRKPSPWSWTLVIDNVHGDHVEQKVYYSEGDGLAAFATAKRSRKTYSATLWRLNAETNTCVKVADFDCGEHSN